jgi:hypothetical protein
MAILLLLAFFALIILAVKTFSVRRNIKAANNKLEQIISTAKDAPVIDLSRYPEITNNSRLNILWSKYLNALRKTTVPSAVNSEDYFGYEKILGSSVTFSVMELVPAILSVLGIVASIFLLLSGYTADKTLDIKNLYPAAEGVVLGLIFMLIQKFAYLPARKAIMRFTDCANSYTNIH